jgi:S-adenosylmethionine:tRNA ribosyltransferase-isomerase
VKTADFDYDLPPELIAQEPARERTLARMMVIDRASGRLTHVGVGDLPSYLQAGDLLVLNDTKVIPARLYGRKADTGGRVELLLIEETAPGVWDALCGASRRPRVGSVVRFAEGRIEGRIADWRPGGRVAVELACEGPLLDALERYGLPPLPPYIRRQKSGDRSQETEQDRERGERDRQRYQTIYARVPGAVAAPTAGLHFTEELLQELGKRGIGRAMVTLHVGPGTFRPVSAEDVEEHTMEAERFTIADAAAAEVNRTRGAGGRIVAVGSTVVRTLETAADEQGTVRPGSGRTEIFIRPPYRFRAVDALLTNFHLPRSTLLMMVSAFAGRDLVRHAYAEAIAQRYRFYSYGDCMLIV